MTKIITVILLGLTGLWSTAQESDRPPGSVPTAFPEWEKLTGPSARITCKPAYYRRDSDGLLVPVEEARRMTNLMVSGVVLTVVEPQRFAGQVLSFHFDYGGEKWDHWYKPGVLYTGIIREGYIGKLAFMCDPGWHAAVTNGVSGAPNPQGGANGRQPFSSETNRASAAAASRRSP